MLRFASRLVSQRPGFCPALSFAFDAEDDGQREAQSFVRYQRWGRWHRIGPVHHGECGVVEDRITRSLHDGGRHDMAEAIEHEVDEKISTFFWMCSGG